jgi:hypothetical protein
MDSTYGTNFQESTLVWCVIQFEGDEWIEEKARFSGQETVAPGASLGNGFESKR